MGKASRTKGQRGEREVAKLLSEWSGEKVQRKLGAPRDKGSDIEFQGWSVEVKYRERKRIQAWWKQAVKQALDEGNLPLLVYRGSREPWSCIFPGTDNDGNEHIVEMLFKDWYHEVNVHHQRQLKDSFHREVEVQQHEDDTEVSSNEAED